MHDHDEEEWARGIPADQLPAYQKIYDRALGVADARDEAAPDVVELSADEKRICEQAGCDPRVFAALKYGHPGPDQE